MFLSRDALIVSFPPLCLVLRTCGLCSLCGGNLLPSTSRDIEDFSFRQKDLGLFLVLSMTRSLAWFLNFKGWLCQVECGTENDCMLKMVTSVTVVFPQTWCILCRSGRSLSACFHRPTVTVLKFWKAETGLVCKASQSRSPGKLPLSSDMRM